MPSDETFLIVTTMKNEGPFMLDWVAYNRGIGFDDIIIYSNDCSDGTDLIGDRLQALGLAWHVPNPVGPRATPQNRAHRRVKDHPRFQSADWVMSLDVDEYINFRGDVRDLREFVRTAGEADAISISWKMFGNGGIDHFTDAPVPEQFLQTTQEHHYPNYKTRGIKTLFRNNGKFNRFRAHRPRIDPSHAAQPDAPYDGVIWRDAGGQLVDPASVNWKVWRGFRHTHARIHHYAVRSTDSFLVKRDRGRTNHVGQDQGLSYWQDMNHNDTTDDSIKRHLPKMHQIKHDMLQDAQLAALHAQACQWHSAKAAELKARPDWSELVAALYGQGKGQTSDDR